jgi:stage II sporulation protein AA (anti-sigma F factor antagonist)
MVFATPASTGKTPGCAVIARNRCGSIASVNPVPFEVSVTDLEGGIQVISVRGELDLSTAPDLERPLEEIVEGGTGPVLLDLSECEFIDSTGIALIVRTLQRLEGAASARTLAVCSYNDQVRRVLDITGLDVSIPVHRTRDEALASIAA